MHYTVKVWDSAPLFLVIEKRMAQILGELLVQHWVSAAPLSDQNEIRGNTRVWVIAKICKSCIVSLRDF